MSPEGRVPEIPDDELTALIDGELGAERVAEVERALAASPVLRARLEQLRSVEYALRSVPVPELSDARQTAMLARIRQRASEEPSEGAGDAERAGADVVRLERPRPLRGAPRRVRWLAPAGVAAALAASVALLVRVGLPGDPTDDAPTPIAREQTAPPADAIAIAEAGERAEPVEAPVEDPAPGSERVVEPDVPEPEAPLKRIADATERGPAATTRSATDPGTAVEEPTPTDPPRALEVARADRLVESPGFEVPGFRPAGPSGESASSEASLRQSSGTTVAPESASETPGAVEVDLLASVETASDAELDAVAIALDWETLRDFEVIDQLELLELIADRGEAGRG